MKKLIYVCSPLRGDSTGDNMRPTALANMLKAEQKVKCDRLQAERVAWRILKDWVEAQMAILESEMVAIDEVFLPYMVDKSGNTLYQAYCCNQLMLEGSVVV